MAKKKNEREFEVGDVFDESLATRSLQARKDSLEGMAYNVTNEGYTKILTEEEVTKRREELSDICIEINDIEFEKKEANDIFKARLKQPKLDRSELLNSIRHKSEFRKGNLYHIADQANGFMYIFDENGECIESRSLKPSEKQTKIVEFTKNGTND